MDAYSLSGMSHMNSTGTDTMARGGILVVDDHELVRLGFRALLQPQAGQGAPVVLEAGTLAEALALYRQQQASIAVVVLDLSLPDSDGPDGLMMFRQQFPAAAVVVLSGNDSPAIAQNVLALGAVAFFPKSGNNLDDMVNFVHCCALYGPAAAIRERSLCAPVTMPAGSQTGADSGELAARPGQALTLRQIQILQWLLEGKSNREISEQACLSEGTVKNHVSTLLLSFGVRSRAQLISKLRT